MLLQLVLIFRFEIISPISNSKDLTLFFQSAVLANFALVLIFSP